jgi:RNA polymerase sigma factor (sigma-70 family)
MTETSSGNGPPDSALVARVLTAGDRHAFAALVRRHQSSVRALLRRLTNGDDALADDLAQETFVLAWRKLDQFRGDARFGTWIYRIAYNTFLMHARSRKAESSLEDLESEASLSVDDAAGSGGEGPASPTEGVADMQMDLRRAMARLSPAERAALVQCYYLDRSHEEAAYVLGCPVGTVKSHVLRAKQKLKLSLESWAPRYL